MENQRISKKIFLATIFLIFGIIYCAISFPNHFLFRTYALDLGMFNHALYSFAHLMPNYFTLDISGNEINYFGDHFSPITILYAPLYYLFGSYTLLVIQIIAILFGGYGIIKYAEFHLKSNWIPAIIVIHFFSLWGIYSALAYDFHNNVVAAMFLSWLLLAYEQKNRRKLIIYFILMLICKENISLWLIFIFFALSVSRMIKEKSLRLYSHINFEFPFILGAMIYFMLVIGIIMPVIRGGEGFDQMSRYSHLGESLPEIVMTLVGNPSMIFDMFFHNLTPEDQFDGIKQELHIMILVSGGFTLLFNPRFIIFLLPIYAQKLFSLNPGMWGIGDQYSIEFVPILSIGLVHFIKLISNVRMAIVATSVITLLTAYFTYLSIEDRKLPWYDSINLAFYTLRHYQTDLNVEAIHGKLHTIPQDATVSTTSALAPHIAFRERIYHFPIVKDSEYVVLLNAPGNYFPLQEELFHQEVLKLHNEFQLIYNENKLMIFKRNI